jgi:hypothetical protein
MIDIKNVDIEIPANHKVIFNYLLDHNELTKQKDRGHSLADNVKSFKEDYESQILEAYKGTAVAYHQGILCGQCNDVSKLWVLASNYYGRSNLTVFEVPKKAEALNSAFFIDHTYN